MSDLKILIPTGPTVALNPDHTLRKVYEAIFGRIDRLPGQR